MLVGQIIDVSSPQGRFFEGAASRDGQRCISVTAFGKHLLYQFADSMTLQIHLGLFGRFRTAKVPAAEAGRVDYVQALRFGAKR
jgi:endonuclease VIII